MYVKALRYIQKLQWTTGQCGWNWKRNWNWKLRKLPTLTTSECCRGRKEAIVTHHLGFSSLTGLEPHINVKWNFCELCLHGVCKPGHQVGRYLDVVLCGHVRHNIQGATHFDDGDRNVPLMSWAAVTRRITPDVHVFHSITKPMTCTWLS